MSIYRDFSGLEDLLSSGQLGEECLDFIEAHGYLVATIIGPLSTNDESLFEEILGENANLLSEHLAQDFRSDILKLKNQISRQLLMAETLEMPCDLGIGSKIEPSDLERWCMAFVEKHFLSEEEWFAENEDIVANLLLPIIAGSGLIDSQEIMAIRDESELFMGMLEDIPELAVDLYAFFHEK